MGPNATLTLYSLWRLMNIEGPYLRPGLNGVRVPPLNAKPYAVDWRFLPDWMLVGKDYVRQRLVEASITAAEHSLTQPLWRATLGQRTLSSLERSNMLLVHVPRTGGTSISLHLYGRNLPHFSMRFYQDVFGERLASMPIFAVIRDPVERFISAYHFVRDGGTQLMASDRFSGFKLRHLHSIEDYVDYFTEDPERRGAILPFAEQHKFILDHENRIAVDRLFAMNRRIGFSGQLFDWLQTPRLPHINATTTPYPELADGTRTRIENLYAHDLTLYHMVMSDGGAAQMRGHPL